jgi:hypothetical protein
MTAAVLAPGAFQRVKELVLPHWQANAEKERRRNEEALASNPQARVTWHQRNFLDAWWELEWRRPAMVALLERLPRYVGVSMVASHQRMPIFSFISPLFVPATGPWCSPSRTTTALASSSPPSMSPGSGSAPHD